MTILYCASKASLNLFTVLKDLVHGSVNNPHPTLRQFLDFWTPLKLFRQAIRMQETDTDIDRENSLITISQYSPV